MRVVRCRPRIVASADGHTCSRLWNNRRLVKRHAPAAIAVDKDVGAEVAAARHFAALAAPARCLDAMHPADRTVDAERGHGHRHAEPAEDRPVILPVPLDRLPAHVRDRIGRRRDQDVVAAAGPTFSIARMSRADSAL
jgi:hypothetical protein